MTTLQTTAYKGPAQPSLFLVPPAALPPPLKWAGGKRWQVPLLKLLWEPHSHRRLVEPFCGGLAVALGLRPARALLSDVNLHLINFYDKLQGGLKCAFDDMRNDEEAYYAARSEFNRLASDPESNPRRRAELFYYLNRTGFNGLCRFNKGGGYNVPFGRYKSIKYERDFELYKKVFQKWTFTNESFQDLRLEDGDFVYADPPYDVPFTTYSSGGFTWRQQEQTARLLSSHRGPVVLANQATPRILKLYAELGFDLQLHDAPRRISCTGDRRPAKEVLATRNL